MKRVDRLNEIKTIYKKFNRAEREVLLSQLAAMQNTGNKGYENSTELIQLISLNPSISREEVISTLGIQKGSTVEINTFFLNVKGFLLENLTLDNNVERPGMYGNRFRVSVSNAKRLAQTQLLIARGLHKQAEKLLEELINRSMKYELFRDALEGQKQMQLLFAFQKGIRTYKRIAGYIDELKVMTDAYDRAHDAYMSYIVDEQRNLQEEAETSLRSSIEILQDVVKKHNLKYAKYLLSLLQTRYHERQHDYARAKLSYERLLEVVRTEPAVQTEQREGMALIGYGVALSHLRNFSEARESFNKAAALFKKSSYENLQINKYLCLLDFYEMKYDSLEKILPKQLNSKFTVKWNFAVSQYKYYKAALLYLKNDFKGAANILVEITSSTNGLNRELHLWSNVLLYMAASELGEKDEELSKSCHRSANDSLQTLYNEDPTLSKREKLIIRLIKRLEGYDRNFRRTATLVKDSLSRLNAKDPGLKWQVLSNEIIPFDLYMNAKAEGNNMSYRIPVTGKKEAPVSV